MEEQKQKPHALQWHPAFYAGIQIELESEARHLKEERGYEIRNEEDGIYYIIGDKIPIQLILTQKLSEDENLWLKSLTDELKETETAKRLLEQYEKHKGNGLYQSVMNLIVHANKEKFQEAKSMCEALEELMKDELEAKKAEGITQGKAEGILELLSDLGQVSEDLKAKIMGQKNIDILNQWLKYAARSETIHDFEQKIQ